MPYHKSAYLCEGKRVLVTSKNANALSVLRGRLPQSIRELVVDVSMSESQGEERTYKINGCFLVLKVLQAFRATNPNALASLPFETGMRQLQQTVERLAVRVSVASADIETEKCSLLQVCQLEELIQIHNSIISFILLTYRFQL